MVSVVNILSTIPAQSRDRLVVLMYPPEKILDSSVRGEKTNIGALASADTKTAAIMVWNYHD
jgi:xylan 1,4-beta-xylosidase